MLLVGSVYGRAGGLILVGLVAALATLAATAVQDLSAGQIDAKPTTAAAVEDRYELGAGEVILDLTDLNRPQLAALDDRTVEIDVRLGHIVVLVPADGLDVDVRSKISGGGESVLFGDRRDGSMDRSYGADDADPDLILELEVLFGQIEVETKEAA